MNAFVLSLSKHVAASFVMLYHFLRNITVLPFDTLFTNQLKNRQGFVIANAVKQSRRLKLDCFAVLAKTRFIDCVQFGQQNRHLRASGSFGANGYFRVNLKNILAGSIVYCSALISPAYAIDPLPFNDQKQEQRFQAITAELRCLQCQNQNLADSDAGLAKDMRLQIFEMMQKGESDQQIKQYMIDRYGDFVIYSPPFNWQNSLLWLLPLLAALSGIAFVVWHFRGARLQGATYSKTGDDARSNTDVSAKAPQVDAGDNW